MDYALHRLMERKDDSVVVIKLDDVDRGKLPKELRKRSCEKGAILTIQRLLKRITGKEN